MHIDSNRQNKESQFHLLFWVSANFRPQLYVAHPAGEIRGQSLCQTSGNSPEWTCQGWTSPRALRALGQELGSLGGHEQVHQQRVVDRNDRNCIFHCSSRPCQNQCQNGVFRVLDVDNVTKLFLVHANVSMMSVTSTLHHLANLRQSVAGHQADRPRGRGRRL